MKRAIFLILLGSLAMFGDITGLDALYALGLATSASPAPKVFTARDGLEGFSSEWTLSWQETDGDHEISLSPEAYARLRGPYNRRNVYGAALAGGPYLQAHSQLGGLYDQVTRYAFCQADILAELGIQADPIGPISLEVMPRPGTQTTLPLVLEQSCSG